MYERSDVFLSAGSAFLKPIRGGGRLCFIMFSMLFEF